MLVPRRETIVRIHDHLIARLGGESGILKPDSRLDNAIARPRTHVYAHEPFKDTISKAAALAHGIISLHPFVDGNKRTGLNVLSLTLSANGINIVYPPYIVKYSVQAALDSQHKKYVDENQFIPLIQPLCSHTTFGRFTKNLRYSVIPSLSLRGYVFLATRLPRSPLIIKNLESRLLDWFAAGDREIFAAFVLEFNELQKQGYPKEAPPLNIVAADMEEIPSSED
jgi:death-on-curing family protein